MLEWFFAYLFPNLFRLVAHTFRLADIVFMFQENLGCGVSGCLPITLNAISKNSLREVPCDWQAVSAEAHHLC
jgi:hypothetical protein